jgi:hypothetical protein
MKQNTHKQRSNRRRIGFNAVPGLDDDLIGWWESLPEGEGSDEIRAALRNHTGHSSNDLAAEVRRLNQQMAALVGQVQALSKQISQGIVVAGNGSPAALNEISAEQAQARTAQILKRKW